MDESALPEIIRSLTARVGDATETERTRGRSVHEERWHVVVLNDDYNTFDGVAAALSQTLPETSFDRGLELASEIHHRGRANVYTGHFEAAEYFWTKLDGCRLTMAPLLSA